MGEEEEGSMKMEDGRWNMGVGRWQMVDGKWEVKNVAIGLVPITVAESGGIRN